MIQKITLFTFTLLLFGCATTKQLPLYESNSSVLVIPKSVINSTPETWTRRFQLEISRIDDSEGKNDFTIPLRKINVAVDNANYILVDDLTPGKYIITNMNMIWNAGWRPLGVSNGSSYELNMPFTLKEGEVNILNWKLFVEQKNGAIGAGVYTAFHFNRLTLPTENSITAELNEHPEASKWHIATVGSTQK